MYNVHKLKLNNSAGYYMRRLLPHTVYNTNSRIISTTLCHKKGWRGYGLYLYDTVFEMKGKIEKKIQNWSINLYLIQIYHLVKDVINDEFFKIKFISIVIKFQGSSAELQVTDIVHTIIYFQFSDYLYTLALDNW